MKSLVTQIQQQRILTLFVATFSSSGKRLEPSGNHFWELKQRKNIKNIILCMSPHIQLSPGSAWRPSRMLATTSFMDLLVLWRRIRKGRKIQIEKANFFYRKMAPGLDREDDLAWRWICQRRLWEAAERQRPKPAKVAPLKAWNFFSFDSLLALFCLFL